MCMGRIDCVGEVILGFLSAEDTALLALDESGIKKSLDVLVEWYRDWGGGEINVNKSGIMHVRQKKWLRWMCSTYAIDSEEHCGAV